MKRPSLESIIRALYRFFLFRETDVHGMQNYMGQCERYETPEQWEKLLESFVTSPEFRRQQLTSFQRKRLGLKNPAQEAQSPVRELLPYARLAQNRQKNLIVTGFPRSGTLFSLLNFSTVCAQDMRSTPMWATRPPFFR